MLTTSWKFAIIGGGLTGTAMLYQLVEKLATPMTEKAARHVELTICVFEKKHVFGPGLPHSDQFMLPFHITNMCAKDMSIRWGCPDDFMNWVQQNRDPLRERYPDPAKAYACPDCRPEACRHYPRAIMGEYLQARFKDAVDQARNVGIAVKLYPNTEVIDLHECGDLVRLNLRTTTDNARSELDVNGALLATGHWFPHPDIATSFTSPWPARSLREGIPPGETVGIVGSSLSAIEVALTLTTEGTYIRTSAGELVFIPPRHPRRIVFHSRRGLLPRVRGKTVQRQNQYLTCRHLRQIMADMPSRLTLPTIFELLDAELTAAYGTATNWPRIMNTAEPPSQQLQRSLRQARHGDGPRGELLWQTVLFQIFPIVRELYLNLSRDERKRFDREYSTIFFMHAATQPGVNAEKLLALMKAGTATVIRLGEDYHVRRHDVTGEYEFTYRDAHGRPRQHSYRYLVDARGQPSSLDTDPAPLTRNLWRRGFVHIEETKIARPADAPVPADSSSAAGTHSGHTKASIVVDPATHRVIQKAHDGTSTPVDFLYAVGAMTRAQMIDASMAYASARSTAAVADHLVNRLVRQTDI